ncbi:WAS/WASL-interacting protein family member 3-like isoform X2 [Pseudoliparis swirei]|uniref:WAS/WASL-interacting protein family member 3-like isoform X2 n=1 Tax=Pseudoliparis swirei TaxID=2059687 RepID=UPI0024BEE8D6|nr:WAS/WASL-interacting protein family member 3-like isoform X2 [Pseudoliparis swirei]
MEDHPYALRGAGDFVGAPPPPPPPPSPPAAAIGIDYGAGGDYDGAPGLPTAIRRAPAPTPTPRHPPPVPPAPRHPPTPPGTGPQVSYQVSDTLVPLNLHYTV